MTGNTRLNFSAEELMSINSSVIDSRLSIRNNFEKVRECFEELKGNVTGTQVNGLMTTIVDNLVTIDSKMEVSFEQLTNFLESQMRNYTTTYESATLFFYNFKP